MIAIDVDMPKRCCDCPVSRRLINVDGYDYYYCVLTNREIYGDKINKKYKKCPLKELNKGN